MHCVALFPASKSAFERALGISIFQLCKCQRLGTYWNEG